MLILSIIQVILDLATAILLFAAFFLMRKERKEREDGEKCPKKEEK